MEIRTQIRDYLDATGNSMRSLSLQAELNPKAVADILNTPGLRPNRKILDALGQVMGVVLVDGAERVTYSRLMRDLSERTGDERIDRRNARYVSRLRLVLRHACWVAETEAVDRVRTIEQFACWTPTEIGLSARSFQTYKTDVLAAISLAGGRNRKSGIRNVIGPYAEIYRRLEASDLPRDLRLAAGSCFYFLDQEKIAPAEITMAVLDSYYQHRLTTVAKDARTCRKHVKRVAHLCTRLATHPDFGTFGFVPVQHPFEDGTDRYGVAADAFTALLAEFDGPVSACLRGECSRSGESMADFIARLDREAATRQPASDKKSLLKPHKGQQSRRDERRSAGFLLPSETWSAATIANRRGMIIAAAKALYASTGYLIESIEELTEPHVVESLLDALATANADRAFESSYVETVGKAQRKLAGGYVARSDADLGENP
ncbi:MAG: hypothetical protein Q4G26_09480 [Paracoccus sp. (in: a-proteobacteria)]|nr:hypothetical protein [Paracoccus sp. (in: a-proteobacteria)]